MNFEEDIKSCIAALNDEGSILYPTDTVWGLGCDALSEPAVERIYTIKRRPKEKGFIVLLAEPKDILTYVAAPPPDIIDIMSGFERPTTVIFEGPLGFPDNLLNNDGTIAIRIPGEPFCKALLKRFRRPIVSTSANISGMPGPQTFDMISAEIKDSVNYIARYRQDDREKKPPSRLVRISEDGTLEILRP